MVVWDNISIYSVVDYDSTGDDDETGPVADDVEAGKDFFYATVDITHLYLEAWLAVLSYEVDVNNKKQPAKENHYG